MNGIDGGKKEANKSFDFETIRNEYRRYTNSAMKLEFDRKQVENDEIWKMRHKNGTAVYGVFWNPSLLFGLGAYGRTGIFG